MAYESPIKVDWDHHLAEDAEDVMRKLMNAEEAHIMYKVNLVVDVDKDELLKALQYDRGQYEKGYKDRDAELVRCKDCVHWKHRSFDDKHYCDVFDWLSTKNDYCSFAEREENAEIH